MFVSDWLVLLNMVISRSIHVAADSIISFFSGADYYFIVCIYIFFTHSSGYLSCFQFLAVESRAAMNIGVHISFRSLAFSWCMPRSRIAASYGACVWRSLQTVLQSGCTSVYSHQKRRKSSFSPTACLFIICRLCDDGHSDQSEVIPLCSFDLHFSNKLAMLSILSCTFWPSLCPLWRNVYLDFLPIFLIEYLLFYIQFLCWPFKFFYFCLIFDKWHSNHFVYYSNNMNCF